MPIPCAVLMCHAPIVVPEIGQDDAPACRGTTLAMADAARRIAAQQPDAVVLIDPHAPRAAAAFGVCGAAELRGDFGRFGAPQLRVALPGAPVLAAELRRAAVAHGLRTFELTGDDLDHGALVPFHFLVRAGYRGPTLLVSLPYPGSAELDGFGRALAAAAARIEARTCVIASGDLSHRLSPGAPAGYHPVARAFDERFRALLARGALRDATAIDPGLRELAAEDAVESCTVAAAALDFAARGPRVLHYESPFGVGYLEAVLYEHDAARGAR